MSESQSLVPILLLIVSQCVLQSQCPSFCSHCHNVCCRVSVFPLRCWIAAKRAILAASLHATCSLRTKLKVIRLFLMASQCHVLNVGVQHNRILFEKLLENSELMSILVLGNVWPIRRPRLCCNSHVHGQVIIYSVCSVLDMSAIVQGL